MTQPALSTTEENRIILLATLIQFVHIVDFMMVMPLGPDFARELGIPLSMIGVIGGSYTFAAAFAALASAFFLDRYARKNALLFFLCGLCLATLAGAFAFDLSSMLAARIIAGLFGGLMPALGNALIADIIPPERRGVAIGKVMGSFALASVLGVPFGLQLSQWFGWQSPFIGMSALGLVTLLLIWRFLPFYPPFETNVPARKKLSDMRLLLSDRLSLTALLLMNLSMFTAFLIIPNVAAHLQLNLHYPRAHLGWLYMAGGACSLIGMRLAGRWVDRTSATRIACLATAMFIVSVGLGFAILPALMPPMLIFIFFMVGNTMRSVCAQTLTSKIPPPALRGGYMALQSTMINLAGALGAFLSSMLLLEKDGQLLHMPLVSGISMACAMLLPFLFWSVEKQLRQRPQAVH